jgi:hypothetical protein
LINPLVDVANLRLELVIVGADVLEHAVERTRTALVIGG